MLLEFGKDFLKFGSLISIVLFGKDLKRADHHCEDLILLFMKLKVKYFMFVGLYGAI